MVFGRGAGSDKDYIMQPSGPEHDLLRIRRKQGVPEMWYLLGRIPTRRVIINALRVQVPKTNQIINSSQLGYGTLSPEFYLGSILSPL